MPGLGAQPARPESRVVCGGRRGVRTGGPDRASSPPVTDGRPTSLGIHRSAFLHTSMCSCLRRRPSPLQPHRDAVYSARTPLFPFGTLTFSRPLAGEASNGRSSFGLTSARTDGRPCALHPSPLARTPPGLPPPCGQPLPGAGPRQTAESARRWPCCPTASCVLGARLARGHRMLKTASGRTV